MSEKTFGCRFALSIMSDRYIDIILGSLAKTDTSRIEASTGRLSTLYRGERTQVLDALEGILPLEELSRRTGIDTPTLLGKLTLLELQGKVHQLPGQNYEKI